MKEETILLQAIHAERWANFWLGRVALDLDT